MAASLTPMPWIKVHDFMPSTGLALARVTGCSVLTAAICILRHELPAVCVVQHSRTIPRRTRRFTVSCSALYWCTVVLFLCYVCLQLCCQLLRICRERCPWEMCTRQGSLRARCSMAGAWRLCRRNSSSSNVYRPRSILIGICCRRCAHRTCA